VISREQLISIARDAAGGDNRPSYCDDPQAFEPHEWVIDALHAAYIAGQASAAPFHYEAKTVKICHPGLKCDRWPECESCGPPRV
jgi:hypothetical protein